MTAQNAIEDFADEASAPGPDVPGHPFPPLEVRTSFLVHKINALLESIARDLFARHGLDLFSSRILVLLLEHKDMRVGELVETMVLPQSTISHQLKRLEQHRLIRRRRARADNRVVSVTLTPQGHAVALECEDLSARVYAAMVAGMSGDDLERLTDLLRGIFTRLQAVDRTPGPEPKGETGPVL